MYLIVSFGFVRSICVHIVLDAITNILGLYLVFVECLHMIGDHKESQLDLDQKTSIIIGLEHQLQYDSVIVMRILSISLICDMKEVSN